MIAINSAIDKASEIIRSRSAYGDYEDAYCVLAQEDLDGRLTAAVITAASADGIKHVNFCSGIRSNWVKRVERDTRAAVCFASDSYSITLRGRLEILTDAETKKDNWYKGLENHYTGHEDPNYCVIRFTTEVYKLFIDWEETEGVI